MKKIFICIILSICTIMACAQNTKTFYGKVFTMVYPSTYNVGKIENAPHMLLKLISNKALCSISKWNNGYDESITAWDLYEYAESFSNPGTNTIKIIKGTMKLKNGQMKCIRIFANSLDSSNSKILTYIFVYKGDLFVCSNFSLGKYNINSTSTNEDKIWTGLYLK